MVDRWVEQARGRYNFLRECAWMISTGAGVPKRP